VIGTLGESYSRKNSQLKSSIHWRIIFPPVEVGAVQEH
jgi:hypothetical protein